MEDGRRMHSACFAHASQRWPRRSSSLPCPASDNAQSVDFVGLDVAGLLTTHTRASAVLAHEGLRARGVEQKTPSSTLIRVRLCDTFGRNVAAVCCTRPCYPLNSSSNALASCKSA